MTPKNPLEACAIAILTGHIRRGDALDAYLATGHSGITPASADMPALILI